MISHDQVQFHNCDKEKALRLCLILGALGVHRFYLHEPLQGVAYLLFSWTLIPLLLCLIDAWFLAHMSDEEFQEEYNDMPHLVA